MPIFSANAVCVLNPKAILVRASRPAQSLMCLGSIFFTNVPNLARPKPVLQVLEELTRGSVRSPVTSAPKADIPAAAARIGVRVDLIGASSPLHRGAGPAAEAKEIH